MLALPYRIWTAIDALAADRGWTTAELARRAHLHPSAVHPATRAPVPTEEEIDAITAALGIGWADVAERLASARPVLH